MPSGTSKALLVHGEPREIDAATLTQGLEALDYGEASVATALNGEFTPARARGTTPVRETGSRLWRRGRANEEVKV